MGDAANMLPANSAIRIEPMRLAMNASHCVARRFVAMAALATIYITSEAVSAASRWRASCRSGSPRPIDPGRHGTGSRSRTRTARRCSGRTRGGGSLGSVLSTVNWENPENFAGRIRQTKTVWFSLGVAFGHKTRPALGGSNRLGFTGQHRRFLLDGNPSPEPFNPEHRRHLLETAGSAYLEDSWHPGASAGKEAGLKICGCFGGCRSPRSPRSRLARRAGGKCVAIGLGECRECRAVGQSAKAMSASKFWGHIDVGLPRVGEDGMPGRNAQ